MAVKGLNKFPAIVSFESKQKGNVHKWIKVKINYDEERKGYPYNFNKDVSFYDCRLPALQHQQPQFQTLYFDAVLEKSLTSQLEKCQALNWCSNLVRLEAVAVPQDGNSLLHAASFAMWGVYDEHFVLRELLLKAIVLNRNESYKQRWWRQKLVDLSTLKDGSKIISKEWDEVVRSISSLNQSRVAMTTPTGFLESVHIYVLSNILRRPIIIVTELGSPSSGNKRSEEGHIAGVYLPLEWPPIKCHKSPLILGYYQGKFCPLLSEMPLRPTKREMLFPLVTKDFCSLSVRFLNRDEEHRASELIQSYFIVKEAHIPIGASGEAFVPCAVVDFKDLPEEMNVVLEHFKICQHLEQEMLTPVGEIFGENEARRLQQLHLSSQTRVAPMRSFSQSYHEAMMKQSERAQPGVDISRPEIASYVEPTAPPASRLNSIEEPTSMLDERCRNKCGYRCSTKTYPFCHQCFGLIPVNQEVPSASKALNNGENLSFLGLAPFNTNDINQPQGNLMLFSPSPTQNLTNLFAGNISKTQETQEHKGNKLDDKHKELTYSDPKPFLNQNKFASDLKLREQFNPEGEREMNGPDHNQKFQGAKQQGSVAMSERRQEGEEENLIFVSGEPIKCVSPFCEEIVSSPNKLCHHCQAVLKRAQKPLKIESVTISSPGMAASERIENLQTQRLNQIQSGQKEKFTPQPVQRQESKTRQRGKPCITSACTNYGDPVHADMCSFCYEKVALREYEKMRREHTKSKNDKKVKTEPQAVVNHDLFAFAPSSSSAKPVKANTVNLPVSAFATSKTSLVPGSRGSMHGSLENFPTCDINAFNQGFVSEYERFRDQSSSGLRKCKISSCTNYGNASKNGYCNFCSARIQQQRHEERIARFGENVPDGCSTQQNSI